MSDVVVDKKLASFLSKKEVIAFLIHGRVQSWVLIHKEGYLKGSQFVMLSRSEAFRNPARQTFHCGSAWQLRDRFQSQTDFLKQHYRVHCRCIGLLWLSRFLASFVKATFKWAWQFIMHTKVQPCHPSLTLRMTLERDSSHFAWWVDGAMVAVDGNKFHTYIYDQQV